MKTKKGKLDKNVNGQNQKKIPKTAILRKRAASLNKTLFHLTESRTKSAKTSPEKQYWTPRRQIYDF